MARAIFADDCPKCGSRKEVHDAWYVEDQEVWHLRCHNCDWEWIE